MYRFQPILIAVAILAGTGAAAYAQEPERTPREAGEMRAEETPTPAVERTGQRAGLNVDVQNRIRNLSANVTNRFSAALSRMDAISGRLDSRIGKLAVEGMETMDASLKLTEANEAIARARILLADIDSIDAAVSGDSPRESYQVIRSQFAAVRDELRTIHALLRETVAILRETPARPIDDTELPVADEAL